uniref:Uncharacterized protein n=1 Tax=Meloidogyne hapla TaxID=6305 RepID=A0A1I8BU89_MELHA
MNIPPSIQCITPEPIKNNLKNNAVVVDSLLCFLYNFRALPQIKTILLNNFSFSSFRHSLELICNFIGKTEEKKFSLNFEQEKQRLYEEINFRLNKLINSGNLPIFATSDLHCLPLRPLFYEDNGNNNNQILDELRQIKFLLQDCLLLHKNVESCSFQNSTPTISTISTPTHSINSIISPELFPPSKSVQLTPLQERLPLIPSLTTSPLSNNSTPAKGLRISQVLQKLSKNKDVVDIVENQTKKLIFENNNGRGNFGEATTSFSPVSIVPPPTPATTTTVIHPGLAALMQIQMLGQLASFSNQQRIFQQNEQLKQQNCLKFLRQGNSAFSINETTKSLIHPKEEENFNLR